MRVEKLKAAYNIETVLVHFPLHPDTPIEGRSMAEFYAGRGIDPEAAYQRMKTLAWYYGLDVPTTRPSNTARAPSATRSARP